VIQRRSCYALPQTRLSAGWVNDFTQAEFIACFRNAEFTLVTIDAVNGAPAEHIYVFSRSI
jgi:hypothetical protein